jgi:hypothetical protein
MTGQFRAGSGNRAGKRAARLLCSFGAEDRDGAIFDAPSPALSGVALCEFGRTSTARGAIPGITIPTTCFRASTKNRKLAKAYSGKRAFVYHREHVCSHSCFREL